MGKFIEQTRRYRQAANVAFAYVRLIYLYALYFGVGLPQESFCWSKGNIWRGIGRLDRAIGCYHESLKALESWRLRTLLGWCYWRAGDNNAALEQYRLAYKAQPRHEIALSMALLEFDIGKRDAALGLLRPVQDARRTLDEKILTQLQQLEAKFGLQPTK